MYIVTIVQLFNNNVIDVQVFDSLKKANDLRDSAVNGLCDLFAEQHFVVTRVASPFGYTSVCNDKDKSTWLVIKVQKQQCICT